MPFLVAAVTKTYKIVDVQPSLRSFRDGNDVMDFGSRLHDLLSITVLTDRMIVAISFGQSSPLRVIPLSVIQRHTSLLYPALIARCLCDDCSTMAYAFHGSPKNHKKMQRGICTCVLTLQTPPPAYPTHGTSQSPDGAVASSVKVDEMSLAVIVMTFPVGV